MNKLEVFGVTCIVSWAAGKLYEMYATQDEKNRFENLVKLHHGEVGVMMAAAGVVSKSPSMIGSGIGLMFHDRKDIPKWFTGDKLDNNSNYSQIVGMA